MNIVQHCILLFTCYLLTLLPMVNVFPYLICFLFSYTVSICYLVSVHRYPGVDPRTVYPSFSFCIHIHPTILLHVIDFYLSPIWFFHPSKNVHCPPSPSPPPLFHAKPVFPLLSPGVCLNCEISSFVFLLLLMGAEDTGRKLRP